MDVVTLQLAKQYAAETMAGAGAIKGDPGPQGPAGPPGPAGNDGFSPTVSVTDISGGHKVTITDEDGPHSFDVMDGKDGTGGGGEGQDGVTFTPSVSTEGVISWTNDGGLPNPDPVNIKGPPGADGETGPQGPQGEQGPPGLAGGGSSENIYSLNETQIGTWIDGKPLYRKVLQGVSGAANSSASIIGHIQDVDAIISNRGYIKTNSGNTVMLNFAQGQYYTTIGYNETNGVYVSTNSSTHASCPITVIAEYTKTTDEASVAINYDFSNFSKSGENPATDLGREMMF